MDDNKDEIIQYATFMSFVHPSFWHTLTELKLDIDKLNENTKRIFGKYNYRDDITATFEVDGTSFNSNPEPGQYYQNVTGTIMNKNTIEDFKITDKAALLNNIGEAIWLNIKNGTWIKDPSILLNFFILSFADLKKFHYYYWFAFPSPSQPILYVNKRRDIETYFEKHELKQIVEYHNALDTVQKCFFAICKADKLCIKPLASLLSLNGGFIEEVDLSQTYFTFVDPSNGVNPGWPLRLFLAALLYHCPFLQGVSINVLALRYSLGGGIDKSYVFTLWVPKDLKATETSGWVGWERNDKGNFGPRLANMSSSMDPVKLAETSSDLNIRLMKWRLVPDLNFNVMKETKCLLLGAGTLGCHVARDLLAWGFRHITFVDYGKVSYSNPTRQVLFTHQDCLGGGRSKAEAAADNLKRILPTVETHGLPIHIPMPGHPVGESLKAETIANINSLTKAIQDHDAIFLLLDTREARWLPTLIAAHHKKIVINAALGFDSYLVMRHGIAGVAQGGDASLTNPCIKGSDLGCYFCNDVTAPGNSVKDRTLDQQCTVTRPGVAAIAGALAVELLVGILQHPLRIEAPALSNLNDETELEPSVKGVLGAVPHSIRGFLHSFENVLTRCVKFKQCIACSETVIQNYRDQGTDFILEACQSGSYLEKLTGLSELQLAAEMTDILTFSDDEE